MFFKKKKIEEPVQEEESLIKHYSHKPVYFHKPKIDRAAVIKNIFQRDFSQLTPMVQGKAVAMDSSVCNCSFRGEDIPNDILTFYGNHSFIGWQACAILRQNPYIDKACTIPAQDAIAPDYKIAYNENNKEEKEVDNEKLAEMKLVSDTDFRIKEICYHANVNKKTFGISLVVPIVDGVDYKKPYSIDKVRKGSYKGMVVVEPYWVAPQLDASAVTNPMNVGFQEPTWWKMPNGELVHKSWCIKRCNSELPDILKPTYYYGGVPLTQKIYERVYAAEKVANEAPQLALTKRMLIADANIANLIANPEECKSILDMVQWCRDNFSVWFKNPEDQVQQIDTSLADFDALVMTQYQLVASIADMPATKLLKTQPKGFNATGEYEQKDYIQSLQAIQDQDYLPILKMHYELFTKSFYGEKVDLSIVFNPVDTPTEKETAEVAKIWADVDASYIGSGVMSADEVRDIRRTEEGSPYSTLADDMEGGEDPELEQASKEAEDMAFDWVDEPKDYITNKDGNIIPLDVVVTDVTENFEGLEGLSREEIIDRVNEELNKLVGEHLETGTPPLQIRIDENKKAHIVDNGKVRNTSKKRKEGAALLTLKEVMKSAKKMDKNGDVDLTHNSGFNKERKESTVEKYVYFEAFIKIKATDKTTGKKETLIHPVEFATEQIKGQDPNLLDLYNIHIKKRK